MGSLEVVVDSSVVIGFLRGHEPEASVLAQLLADGRAMMTAIMVFELESGLSGYDQWADKISAFTEAVPIQPLDLESARWAGLVERGLRQQGIPIGVADVLIAGICLAGKRPLFTLNRAHFARVDGLRLFTPDQTEPPPRRGTA